MSKKKISTRLSLDSSQLAAQLRALASSFEDGKVVIAHESNFVSLVPTNAMQLELEAETKKGKNKLSLELSWQQHVAVEGPSSLLISSEEPELPPEEPEEADDEDDASDESSEEDV